MQELILTCAQDVAEALSDALFLAGVLSVSVEDADGDTAAEVPLYGEPGSEPDTQAWRRNRVVSLLAPDQDVVALLAYLRDTGMGDFFQAGYELRDLPDQDWVRVTQSQFGPMQIAGRIWVVPSWHRDTAGPWRQPGSGQLHIELDPGLAFGTGSHATTRLCLEWLVAHSPEGKTVLDYGCGSGILAIAAALMGARHVQAVDIDPQAVQATRANAAVNQVQLRAMLPDELAPGTSDVVLANILSTPLKMMAPMLSARLAPGGFLVLSGILDWQAQELIDTYAPWLALKVWKTVDGWVCLHGHRPIGA